MNDLFVGNIITVYARQFKITAFGDTFTKKALDNQYDRTFILIKPCSAYEELGKIIHQIQFIGFRISNVLLVKLTPQDSFTFNDPALADDFSVGIELLKENAYHDLLTLNIKNAYISVPERLQQDVAFFFSRQHQPDLTDCSCLVVKPHALQYLGQIIDLVIEDGF